MLRMTGLSEPIQKMAGTRHRVRNRHQWVFVYPPFFLPGRRLLRKVQTPGGNPAYPEAAGHHEGL
eukprot:11595993-Prorocentrum_lima.AAC.1